MRFSIFRYALVRALVIALVLSVVPLMDTMPERELGPKHHLVNLSILRQFLFDKLVEPFWGNYKLGKLPEVVISDIAAELLSLKLLYRDFKVL